MQKPITIIRKELIGEIVEAINKSGLPFFVVESILQTILDSVQAGMRAQEEKDAAEYAEYLKKMAAQAQDGSGNAAQSETEG